MKDEVSEAFDRYQESMLWRKLDAAVHALAMHHIMRLRAEPSAGELPVAGNGEQLAVETNKPAVTDTRPA